MFMWRVTRPMPARRQHLDHQQSLSGLALRQYVAHVAAIGARSPPLLTDLLRTDQARLQPTLRRRRAHCELASTFSSNPGTRASRNIDGERFSIERAGSRADAR